MELSLVQQFEVQNSEWPLIGANRQCESVSTNEVSDKKELDHSYPLVCQNVLSLKMLNVRDT